MSPRKTSSAATGCWGPGAPPRTRLLVDFRQAKKLQQNPRLDGEVSSPITLCYHSARSRVRPIRMSGRHSPERCRAKQGSSLSMLTTPTVALHCPAGLQLLSCSEFLVADVMLSTYMWQPATNTDRPTAGQSSCFFLLSLKALSIVTDSRHNSSGIHNNTWRRSSNADQDRRKKLRYVLVIINGY
jgi:hypothetical protein